MNKTNFKTMLLAGLMALTGAAGFTACSDSDDDNNGSSDNPDGQKMVAFDDLSYFQNSIVIVDSLGNFMQRNYGEPLYDNDTTNVYIGVETLEEAREIFGYWLAPDVKVNAQTPSTTDVTATLTDKDGNVQGEVYFKAVNDGTTIAEVTTTGPLRHFSKVIFIPNSAWPHNVQQGKYVKGEIVTTEVAYEVKDDQVVMKNMNMVCVRSQSNGVKAMLVGISNETLRTWYYAYSGRREIWNHDNFRTNLATESIAREASQIMKKSWNFFVQRFEEAGEGPLKTYEEYWLNDYDWHTSYASMSAINLSTSETNIYDVQNRDRKFYGIYVKVIDELITGSPIQYIDCSWDESTKTVKEEIKTLEFYNELTSSDYTNDLQGDWYVVKRNDVKIDKINVVGTGNHLVLCDGSRFYVKQLHLEEGADLTIHCGPNKDGILEVNNKNEVEDAAGIGGFEDQTMGTLIVMGGNITAYGYARGAGIGGGDAGHGGTMYVYGGYIKAYGGEDAAGIGGGEDGRGTNITIYGGKIEATARLVSSSVGAGIGGGQDAGGGIFTMYGGDVYAEGGVNAAGIGGGEDGTSGPITIYGGKVVAKGGDCGAGIGSGFAANSNDITIYGGDIEAYGGNNAAGIGTGQEGKTSNINSGTIDIRGGKVYAVGDGYGAGIGAGREATCGTIGIAGGRVDAHAGSACGPWSGGIGAYHSEHEDGCHIEWAGWQRIYIGACMRLWTYSPGIGVIENVHYTENWWNFVHQRPQVAFGECNHVDGAYDITNCPYCHSYTLKLE